jgi:hypothetical protein
VLKSRGVRWAGHVAHMEELRNAYKVLVENLKKGRDYWEDLVVDWKIY